MAFDKKATRRNARLRLAISGTAGAGKTYSALLIAKEFGGRIGLIDSERGSSQKYAGAPGIPEFFVEDIGEKTVQEYLAKIQEAADAGIEMLVIDSYSHSWIGALEMVDKMGGSKFSNGWKEVSPLVSKLVDSVLSYPGHVIATMRSKAEYAIEKNEQGKATPKKIGMATVARDGTDYEFDVMLDLTPEGGLSVSKTRCSALNGQLYTRDDIPKIAKALKAWLTEGAPVSAKDTLADKIKFAQTVESLLALVPEIKTLAADDQAALKPAFVAKKNELVDSTGAE